MNVILDTLIVVIAFLCIVLSVKRGFVKTALELIFNVFGFFIVLYIAQPVANFISKHFISPTLQSFVIKSLKQLLNESAKTVSPSQLAIDKLIADAPEGFIRLLTRFNTRIADLVKIFANSETVEQGRQKAVEAIVAPAAQSVSYIIAFILCLIVVILLSKVIITVINMIFNLPLLHGINKSLGFVAGVFQAAFFVIVFVNLVRLAIPLTQNFTVYKITPEVIDKTVIFSQFYKIDIIDYFKI